MLKTGGIGGISTRFSQILRAIHRHRAREVFIMCPCILLDCTLPFLDYMAGPLYLALAGPLVSCPRSAGYRLGPWSESKQRDREWLAETVALCWLRQCVVISLFALYKDRCIA